jgi:hypothetical protein
VSSFSSLGFNVSFSALEGQGLWFVMALTFACAFYLKKESHV